MRKMILLAAVSLLFACNAKDEDNDKTELPDAKPIELKLIEKVKSDNVFAFDLFKTTCQNVTNENVFISPLSVSMALNMTANGANGKTLTEMLVALRAEGYTMEQINEYSRSLSEALTSVDPSTQMSIANSIWYKTGYQVNAPFLNVNRSNYNAEVQSLNFASPDAVKQINGWCAKNTNDKIKEIIDGISPDVVMYLINAIYFKGIWLSKFDKKDTKQEDFYAENGQTQKVDMMRQTQDFNYTNDENAEYLELPYGNKAFSMVLMLPNEGKTTKDVINSLNSNTWNQMTERLRGVKANLRLPRFKAECKYEDEMKGSLMQMGMNLPFSDEADFTGINSNGGICISRIIHKTFVELNEEGTEAAAVTAVEMIESTAGSPQTVNYHVNKPFVFAIYEKSTGVILFIGKMGEFK